MKQVSIIGRLRQDPELRYTPSGKAVARMSVAVNERYGENERAYWFPVICWNGLAEVVSQYLQKGSKVAVSGRLTTRSYEREGETRTLTEIIANSVDFLDPKPMGNDADGPRKETPVPDDEIPF